VSSVKKRSNHSDVNKVLPLGLDEATSYA
jgi:hypothetical protein